MRSFTKPKVRIIGSRGGGRYTFCNETCLEGPGFGDELLDQIQRYWGLLKEME